jgi:hypothetical protein
MNASSDPVLRIDPPRMLYVADSKMAKAGRGVFAGEAIPEGTRIEQCPVVYLTDPKDRDRLRKTGLVNYYFLWGGERSFAAICLGWGSVYNHSFEPNARYEKVIDDNRMDFFALRDIAAGEEVTVNYNGTPSDTRRLRIPGIPAEAGGPLPADRPRIIDAFMRRIRLMGVKLFSIIIPYVTVTEGLLLY